MLIRIITAAAGLCVFLPVMYFSGTYALNIFIALISVIAAYELLNCVGLKKNLWVSIPLYLYSLILPLNTALSYKYIFVLSALFLSWIIFTSVFMHEEFVIQRFSALAALGIYVMASFATLIILRRMEYGEYILWLVFIGAWITDTAAYFTGRFLGRHKLIPLVSPKKTVEGAIGGVVFCTIAFVVYGVCVEKFANINANLVFLAVAGVVSSVVSQLGDLVMSKLKRTYDIKDFSRLLPGHGGILDRFDSILAVSVFLAILTSAEKFMRFFG